MNKGYIKLSIQKITEFRRPPQVKSSKAQIYAKFHKIPEINFEERQLTSFAGALIFQMLFKRIGLKNKLKKCFSHLKLSPIFGHHIIVLLLIVHLILGFRRIREIDYYREDPMILRLMGLRKLPDASTISRSLALLDDRSVENVRRLSRSFVISGLQRELFSRLTMDFDGSVLSTKGHAEGSAIGFNKVKKGARSYYPLFCTIAQTSQFFDLHHRPGNVHDSNGAAEFMENCFYQMRSQVPGCILEARMDGAFFNQDIIKLMANKKVRFTASVPFARFTELKKLIENCDSWTDIDDQWSFFETQWKPKSWDKEFRFVFTRKKFKKPLKGPLQLDLFEPVDREYQYKVVVTNKVESAKSVILFHNGRGSQEAIFGSAKNDTALSVIPCKRLFANKMFTLSSMMAHNISQEMQMLSHPASGRAKPKRPSAWRFQKLDTIRHRIIQRAGRFTRPGGKLTLTMNSNQAVKKDLLHFLEAMQKAA